MSSGAMAGDEMISLECVVTTHCAVIVPTLQVSEVMKRLEEARLAVLAVKPHSYRGPGSTFILVDSKDEVSVRAAIRKS